MPRAAGWPLRRANGLTRRQGGLAPQLQSTSACLDNGLGLYMAASTEIGARGRLYTCEQACAPRQKKDALLLGSFAENNGTDAGLGGESDDGRCHDWSAVLHRAEWGNMKWLRDRTIRTLHTCRQTCSRKKGVHFFTLLLHYTLYNTCCSYHQASLPGTWGWPADKPPQMAQAWPLT